MNNWEMPNKSDSWEQNIDYVMFIDENNSVSSLDIVKRKLFNNEEVSPNENIFTVTGCIFSKGNYIDAKRKFDILRKKYWANGKYLNPKTELLETICFHTEDIRGRKKAFHNSVLSDENYPLFIEELDNTINELKYKIISININLSQYILKSHYKEPNVYKIAFNFIIERFIYSIGNSSKGQIIFEARGKNEDKDLLKHINRIINESGTEFIRHPELQLKIKGVYFNKKKNDNDHPYTGLEIADLSSYPIHRFVKFNSIGRDFETIKLKINGYPNFIGKGIKIYPNK